MSEIEKILKACVGAVQTVAEKTGEVVDALAEKGAPAYEKAKEAGADMVGRIRDAVNSGAVQQEMKEISDSLTSFSREQLASLKRMIEQAEQELERKEAEAASDGEEKTEETEAQEEILAETEETPEEASGEPASENREDGVTEA